MSETRHPAETRTPRMDALARLPVFFALAGKRVVVAGGRPAAAWKVELLSATGAQVDVFAPDASTELHDLVRDVSNVTLHARDWTEDDLTGAAMAIGDFDDEVAAERFTSAARAAGVPVNVIDKPKFCDFAFGAIVNRSPLVIGISTDGAAPVFGQAIRAKLEALLPQGFAKWTEAARRWRAPLKTSGLSFEARRRFWQLFTARAIRAPEHAPEETDYASLLAETQTQARAARPAPSPWSARAGRPRNC